LGQNVHVEALISFESIAAAVGNSFIVAGQRTAGAKLAKGKRKERGGRKGFAKEAAAETLC
jgi:hypothetical protein